MGWSIVVSDIWKYGMNKVGETNIVLGKAKYYITSWDRFLSAIFPYSTSLFYFQYLSYIQNLKWPLVDQIVILTCPNPQLSKITQVTQYIISAYTMHQLFHSPDSQIETIPIRGCRCFQSAWTGWLQWHWRTSLWLEIRCRKSTSK